MVTGISEQMAEEARARGEEEEEEEEEDEEAQVARKKRLSQRRGTGFAPRGSVTIKEPDEEEEEEEEEEEAAVDMGHRRQFVVAETESGTSAAAEPEPEIEPTQGKDSTGAVPAAAGGAGGEVRSKTPARPMKRSKTPQAPRAKTPSAPRAKTPAGTSP